MKHLVLLASILCSALLGIGGLYLATQYGGLELPEMPWESSSQAALIEEAGDDASQSSSGSSGPRVQRPTVTMGSTQKPQSDFDVPDSLKAAIKANRDTVAWLQLAGAEVNDSVLQYIDNVFYERRDERQNYDIYGCYFLDYECPMGTRESLARNTVIYGHSAPNDNPDGKRFSKLFRFTDLSFAKANPAISLASEEDRMDWEIFAVFYTDISFDYIQVHVNDEQFLNIVNTAKNLSLYDYGIDVTTEDKILTLSTCSDRDGSDGTHRFVVMARLLPEGSNPPQTVSAKKK